MARRTGETQGRILDRLKRHGPSTVPALADALDRAVETVRTHLRRLEREGLVRREGRRRKGPGRPEIVFGLAPAAQALFPNHEAELLRDLARFLEGEGRADVIRRFFDARLRERRDDALARVAGLTGEARLDETVRILAEDGFMPEVGVDDAGRPLLRLTHCPIRGLVDVTPAPCRAEIGFVRELLGTALVRVSYIPAGDSACCYALEVVG